jgi:hypothetical protein
MNPILCKVCDQGVLTRTKVYRMSAPVVVIGYVLLIPSMLGVAFAMLIFLGATFWPLSNGSGTAPATYEVSDIRKACLGLDMADSPIGPTTPEFCECVVQNYRMSRSVGKASDECVSEYEAHTLPPLDDQTKQLYAEAQEEVNQAERAEINAAVNNSPEPSKQAWESRDLWSLFRTDREATLSQQAPNSFVLLARAVGATVAIAIGVAAFVGGLLGWLLVMRKRVLKCSYCGSLTNVV